MHYSVQHQNLDLYKITIAASNKSDELLLSKPLNLIGEIVYQHFDQAIKEALGEEAVITATINEDNLPNEILAIVAVKGVAEN